MLRAPSLLAVSWSMILAGAVGCATPAPLVSLRPIHPDVVWVAGRASIQRDEGGVRIATAFEHQDGGKLALRLEVQNHTQERINIGPSNVTYIACVDRLVSSCSARQRVIDPEQVLTRLDEKQSIDSANAANEMALAGPLLLLSVVADATSIATGNANRETGLQTAALAQSMDHAAARHDSLATSIAAQKQLWSNVALRRSTLFPDRGCGGLVYIPIHLEARFIWIYVQPPGMRALPFYFQQVVTQVDDYGTRAPTQERSSLHRLQPQ